MAETEVLCDAIKIEDAIDTGSFSFHEMCDGDFNRTGSAEENIQSSKKTYNCNSVIEKRMCGQSARKPYESDFFIEEILKLNRKAHACNICGICFNQIEALNSHKNLHRSEKPYNCQSSRKPCDHDGVNENRIHNKSARKSNESDFFIEEIFNLDRKLYECDVCGSSFDRVKALNSHKVLHSSGKPHKCKLSGNAYDCNSVVEERNHDQTASKSNKSDLFIEEIIDFDRKPYDTGNLSLLDICSDVINQPGHTEEKIQLSGPSNESNGMSEDKTPGQPAGQTNQCDLLIEEIINSNGKIYEYDVCGSSFNQIEAITSPEKPFRCHICDATFKSKQGHRKHVLAHTNLTAFKCHICDATFKSKQGHKIHVLGHTGIKRFKCDMCAFATNWRESLQHHMKSIHAGGTSLQSDVLEHSKGRKRNNTVDKLYRCDTCQMEFTTKKTLQSHELEAHFEEMLYKCNACNSIFKSAKLLAAHKKVHSNVRPFKCHICEYATQGKRSLTVHIRIHTGEKRHQCDKCEYSCTQSSALTGHKTKHTREKPYKCDDCEMSFKTKPGLNIHKIKHAGKKDLCCELCGEAFYHKYALAKHKWFVHNSDKPYACDVCDFRCKTKGNLVIHKQTHSSEKPYKCGVCHQYSAHQKCNLLKHMQMHTGENPLKCCFCDFTCKQKINLTIHERKHSGKRDFKCQECGSAFFDKGSLTRHKKTHTIEKRFKCDDCEYTCDARSDFVKHKRVHTGEKPYKCYICDYACRVKGDLNRHIRKHTGEKPQRCDICGFTCNSHSTLVQHKRRHTGVKPYKCNVCGSKFVLGSDLIRHKSIHSGERPYKCQTCGYACRLKTLLTLHNRSHTNERPYVCHVCGVAFRRGFELSQHRRVHTNLKPFICKLCGFSYKYRSSLTSHMRNHSREKPYKCDVCDYTTRHNNSLIVHKKRHTGLKPYKCTICDYAFHRNCTLIRHKRTHTGDISKSGSRRRAISPVKRNNRQNSQLGHYMYNTCGQLERDTSDCLLRNNIKDNNSLEKAKVCSRNAKFRKHTVTRIVPLDEQPYECDICGFYCDLKDELVAHIKAHICN